MPSTRKFQQQTENGTLLIANVNSGIVTLVNPVNLKKRIDIKVGDMPHEVEVSPNGEYALVSNYGGVTGKSPGSTLTLIDIKNAKVIDTIHLEKSSRPHGICFVTNKRVLVTAQGTNSLLDLEFSDSLKTFYVKNQIKLPATGGHMVTVNPEKTFAYVGCFSGNVCKIRLAPPFDITSLSIGSHAEGVALTPDGTTLLATMPIAGTVAIIDTDKMAVLKSIPTGKWPSRAIIYNNGKSALIVNTVSGTLSSLNLETMKIDRTYLTEETVSVCKDGISARLRAILPVPINVILREDRYAFITNLHTSHVACLDLTTGKIKNLKTRVNKAKLTEGNSDLYNGPDGIAYSNVSFNTSQNKISFFKKNGQDQSVCHMPWKDKEAQVSYFQSKPLEIDASPDKVWEIVKDISKYEALSQGDIYANTKDGIPRVGQKLHLELFRKNRKALLPIPVSDEIISVVDDSKMLIGWERELPFGGGKTERYHVLEPMEEGTKTKSYIALKIPGCIGSATQITLKKLIEEAFDNLNSGIKRQVEECQKQPTI